MLGIILAAGRGSRLKHLSNTRSKALQPILGKAMILRVVESLNHLGVERFIFVIRPNDTALKSYLETSLPECCSFDLAYQEESLGMGHALMQAVPLIDSDFILSACDNLVPQEDMDGFIDFWENTPEINGLLTLMPLPREKINRSGIVVTDDNRRITKIVEKPAPDEAPSNMGSLPIYAFSQRILPFLKDIPLSERGEYELQDAIQALIDSKDNIFGYPVSKRLTVTHPEDLLEVNLHYISLGIKPASVATLPASTTIIEPVYIDPGVKLGENCSIGPNVYLEQGCTIGGNSVISESIVLKGMQIPDGSEIRQEVAAPS